jgi:hypothetical protein
MKGGEHGPDSVVAAGDRTDSGSGLVDSAVLTHNHIPLRPSRDCPRCHWITEAILADMRREAHRGP